MNAGSYGARTAVLICAALGVTLARAAPQSEARWSLPPHAKISSIEKGILAGYENHPDVRYCHDFSLSEQQVRAFFRNSKLIGPNEQHYDYDWSPCVVRGRLVSDKDEATWEISATLVGHLQWRDGRELVLGCNKRCTAIVYKSESRKP